MVGGFSAIRQARAEEAGRSPSAIRQARAEEVGRSPSAIRQARAEEVGRSPSAIRQARAEEADVIGRAEGRTVHRQVRPVPYSGT